MESKDIFMLAVEMLSRLSCALATMVFIPSEMVIPGTENCPFMIMAEIPFTVRIAVESSMVPETVIGEDPTVMRFAGDVIMTNGPVVSFVALIDT